MGSSLGERLAWARHQMGLRLQQVAERSGLNIGYISQLENGSKVNPTLESMVKLAAALGVSVAFLVGEGPGAAMGNPLTETGAAILHRFQRFLHLLPDQQREQLLTGQVEDRFRYVVDFLCTEYPTTWNRSLLATRFGISVRGFNEILDRGYEVSSFLLEELRKLTGIPISFFATGYLKTESTAEKYEHVLELAVTLGLSPDQVMEALVQYVDPRRGGARMKAASISRDALEETEGAWGCWAWARSA